MIERRYYVSNGDEVRAYNLTKLEYVLMEMLAKHNPFGLLDIIEAYINCNRSIDIVLFSIEYAGKANMQLLKTASLIKDIMRLKS